MSNTEYQRIRSRLDELHPGLSDAEASLRATDGRNRDLLRNIKRARAKRPGGENLEGLAELLQKPVEWLLSPDDSADAQPMSPRLVPAGSLPYGGRVNAGYFLAVDEFNQDLEHYQIPLSIPRHPGYPNLQQAAYLVQGDSMDLVGIKEGMWVVAASYGDWIDKIGELDNGNYVIAQRTKASGSEIDRTVKEVQFARRGMRLIPRSSNPVHKEFFIDLDTDADPDTEEVSIIGVVLWFGNDVDPRSKR